MDLNDAMKAHADWSRKFREAIDTKQKLDVETISKDNQCALGKWLHGEAKDTYAKLAAYHTCVGAHAHFHRNAGEMALLINRKDSEQARGNLMPGSKYREAAEEVALAIYKFKEEAKL